MTLQQASAVFIIVTFALGILWGRSTPGRALLTRLFGRPEQTAAKSGTARSRPRRPSAAAPRPSKTARPASSTRRVAKK